jgi:hypothetical protein
MKENTKQYYDHNGMFIIKPYCMKDLATIYDVDARTFQKWMNTLVPTITRNKGRYFTILEVTMIIEAIGIPKAQ